ncbi:MAG: hypothetical protein LBU32_13300 [Clostridiales bacterium]|nr:hypothetical protein [Clostridiales bacterium]
MLQFYIVTVYFFPVGNVDSKALHPFTFEEFYGRRTENILLEEIKAGFAANTALNQSLHKKAMELY